ncbi:MAG: transcriptional regulator [Rhodospirillales bacterium]|jgi:TetR/AcrR family transcriptional repressor of nem operon|nr:transcriptional regulator [Rhodospirillales bacterium]
MGRSRAEKAATHARIVEVAARRFRETGLDGIGVADLMQEAGLTVGGFYKHFASRDDLVVEALMAAFEEIDALESRTTSYAQLVGDYLSEAHRDAPGTGCAIGALLGDVSRGSTAAKAAYTERVERSLDFVAGLVDGADPAQKRAKALMTLSACLGALGLSRAVDDPALSREILDTVARELLQR